MNLENKQLQKYVRAVERRLCLPRELRERVISDYTTSITARLEQGETPETVLASLGSARDAAAELNEQMKEFTYRRSPWRFAFLGLAIVSLIGLIPQLWMLWFTKAVTGLENASIAVIGGADGPTSIMVTSTTSPVPELLVWFALLAVGIVGFVLLHRVTRRK